MTIALLIGPSGSGKTTACRQAAGLARARGLAVAGFVSPPHYQGRRKTAILLHDLSTGGEQVLARLADKTDRPTVGEWVFDEATVVWGQHVLDQIPECDLLVIDEIGPLELYQGQGLTNALNALERARYGLAVVSARPSLVKALEAAVAGADATRLVVDDRTREQIPHSIVALLMGDARRAAQASPGAGREDRTRAGAPMVRRERGTEGKPGVQRRVR